MQNLKAKSDARFKREICMWNLTRTIDRNRKHSLQNLMRTGCETWREMCETCFSDTDNTFWGKRWLEVNFSLTAESHTFCSLSALKHPFLKPFFGPYPQYGWHFPGRNSVKIPERPPETLSERFLEFPSRVRLGCPKPYNSRHWRLPEHFQNSLPIQYGWGRFFFSEVVPERASPSRSWNSQQYWGYFWCLFCGKQSISRERESYFRGKIRPSFPWSGTGLLQCT